MRRRAPRHRQIVAARRRAGHPLRAARAPGRRDRRPAAAAGQRGRAAAQRRRGLSGDARGDRPARSARSCSPPTSSTATASARSSSTRWRAAKARGVEVRVLIDDVSSRFSLAARRPSRCRRAGVPLGIFNPPLVPARLHAANLRNHRKIMVVDGALGFTGGMNIARRYWRDGAGRGLPRPALPPARAGGGAPRRGVLRRLGLHHRRAPAAARSGSRRSRRPAACWRAASSPGPTRPSAACAGR